MYHTWATKIDLEVNKLITEGDEPNPYFFPSLAKKILDDSKEMPMWSCVVRDHFGYGHVPASSAIVESDFNNLKSRLLKKKVGFRADVFVQLHLDYLNGHSKLISGEQKSKDNESDSPVDASTRISSPVKPRPISEIECLACKNGNLPTGAHRCVVCSSQVHILEECSVSVPGEEEGYGERRICRNCSFRSAIETEECMSQSITEKWGGYENQEHGENSCQKTKKKKKTKKSFYLQKNFKETDFPVPVITGKSSHLAILKNGNSSTSKYHVINGIKYSLENTCAFDSFTQVIVKAIRTPALRESIQSWNAEFGEFVIKLDNSGKLITLINN